MKKLLVVCVVVFVVSVIVGWGGVAGAVPAPEPPTTVLIPEGDVPGRSQAQGLPVVGSTLVTILVPLAIALFVAGLVLSLLRYLFVVRRPRRDS